MPNPTCGDQRPALNDPAKRHGRQERAGGRSGRRPWRPRPRRRRRMERARRPCRGRRPGHRHRGRGQLPDGRTGPDPARPVIRSESVAVTIDLFAPPGACRAVGRRRHRCRSPAARRPLALRGGRRSSEADAVALLDSIAENLLALSPESATRLGIDKGARAALRSRLGDRSQPGQDRFAATLRADLATRRGGRHCGAHPFDPHQPRGRAERLSHRARWLRSALWRCRGRRLAQHALCRDPECRRLSRRAALPRHRPSRRKCRRCRGLSRPARAAIRPSSTASSAASSDAAAQGPDRPRLS